MNKNIYSELNRSDSRVYVLRYNCMTQKPMTIYFKSRGTGFLTVLNLYLPKILKTGCLSKTCEQKHFYSAKLNRFHKIIRMTLQWHYTEAPWPFISKVHWIFWQFCNYLCQKIEKLIFYQRQVNKNIYIKPNWSDSVILSVLC